eukprot:4626649-Amphidinium_carterae.1
MSKSVVGQLVLDRHHNRASSLEESLEATLHGKAPSTVIARARAVKRYAMWADGQGLNVSFAEEGWQGAVEAAGSPRVKGLMQQQLLWLPQANQAAPLTAEQVRTLEQT